MRFLVRLFMSVLVLTPPGAAPNSGGSKSLSEAEKTGEELFLQRCSLCHLGYAYRYVTYGPPLYDERIAEVGEKAVRQKIMDGSPLMPGWKYALKPSDVDNIIAYLKMVKKGDIPVAGSSDVNSGEADK